MIKQRMGEMKGTGSEPTAIPGKKNRHKVHDWYRRKKNA